MHRLLTCLCLVILFGCFARVQSQDFPKWDFTASYTLNRFQTVTSGPRTNFNGFTAAPAYNPRRWWAVEGDLTYTTKSSVNLFTYLGGPRFTKRIARGGSATHRQNHAGPSLDPANEPKYRFEPYVHALFGGGHLSIPGNTTNGWAGKIGGGLDVVAGKHVAIRVIEIDYYRYHGHQPILVPTQRLDNIVFSFGIKFF